MSNYSAMPPNPDRVPPNDDRHARATGGRGVALLIGILVAIVLVGGLIYFTGNRGSDRVEQARVPVDRTLPAPAGVDRTDTTSRPADPTANQPGTATPPR